jgi:predicted component of type VI protein secretion system
MAAMILYSPRAVEMSVYVVRAFVKLRELLASNRELARRFEQLEARVEKLVAHDQALGVILSAIRKLMPPPPEPPKNRPIGFTTDLDKET